MCGIFGAVGPKITRVGAEHLFTSSRSRGRDAWGVECFTSAKHSPVTRYSSEGLGLETIPRFLNNARELSCMIGAWRGEPTTEIVANPLADVNTAPFSSPGGWHFVHNGTIANDRMLLEALKVYRGEGYYRPETRIDSAVIGVVLDVMTERMVHLSTAFHAAIKQLVGSFAILAVHESHPDQIWYACNYQPLYTFTSPAANATYVAAQPQYLPAHEYADQFRPIRVAPYSWGRIVSSGLTTMGSLYQDRQHPYRVLAICSAGIDSTTAAIYYRRGGCAVTLIHLDYNCKAGEAEMLALQNIAEHEEMEYRIVKTDFFSSAVNTSTLTDASRDVGRARSGEEGAEFAVDWVPARNTVMLALATAYAEAHGFDIITCGFNLEEQAAFPDNSIELINTWNRGLPWMVADGKRLRVESPTINLMKHEIVKLGLELGVPYELTVSCYTPQVIHGQVFACGHCGPCINSKRAFGMNGAVDPRHYVGDES